MRQPSHKHERGFTLIELLIVIAIIAILALIAIPNFLEAQVRARVSRVHADMRSIGTALEAYLVDYQIYPLSAAEFTDMEGQPGWPAANHGNQYCLSKLTTPVAYMTSILPDPFVEKGFMKKEGADPAEGTRNTFDYDALHSSPLLFGIGNLGTKKNACYSKGYRWVLTSLGPAKTNATPEKPTNALDCWEILAPKKGLSVYDPTNGTVSFGFIMRTNKGVYTGQDYRD